jgi:hypothetical protein
MNYRGLCGAKMKPEQVRRVRAAVAAGFNISEITRGGRGLKSIVTFNTLKRYRVEHPEFDRFIIESARDPRSIIRLRKFEIVPANQRFDLVAPAVVKLARKEVPPFLLRDDDIAWIRTLIPRSVPDYARADALQDAFVALSAREISREELPAAMRKIASRYVQLKTDGRDPRAPWSLDAPAYREGAMLRGETVSEGLWECLSGHSE